MIDCPDNTISIKSHHKKYVVAETNGEANANGDIVGLWETFTIESLDVNTIALKSQEGKYLVAEDSSTNYEVNANSDAIGEKETFTVIKHAGGTVSFRTTYGRYLVAERDGRLRADRTWMRAWEKFSLECVKGKFEKYY